MNDRKDALISKTIRKRQSKFPFKLEQMLRSAKHQNSICWSEDGSSVIIKNTDDLTQILPLYFKTHRPSSFNRQLNIFGFKHSKNELNQHIIQHPLFTRECNQLEPLQKKTIISIFEQHQELKHDLSLLLIEQQQLQQQVVILMQIQMKIQKLYEQIFKNYLVHKVKEYTRRKRHVQSFVLLLRGFSTTQGFVNEVLLSHTEFFESCLIDPEEEKLHNMIITPQRYFS